MSAVATYLEMYASENAGRYPERLAFYHRWPACLTAFEYSCRRRPDSYSLRCTGWHYARAGFRKGYPHYSSSAGWCMAPEQ